MIHTESIFEQRCQNNDQPFRFVQKAANNAIFQENGIRIFKQETLKEQKQS